MTLFSRWWTLFSTRVKCWKCGGWKLPFTGMFCPCCERGGRK